jgi:hypothetical protein
MLGPADVLWESFFIVNRRLRLKSAERPECRHHAVTFVPSGCEHAGEGARATLKPLKP